MEKAAQFAKDFTILFNEEKKNQTNVVAKQSYEQDNIINLTNQRTKKEKE